MFNRAIIQKTQVKPAPIPLKAKPFQDHPPLAISVDEMGRELGISRKSAFKLAHQPGFPVVHIGGRIVINYRALQQWVDEHTAKDNQ